MAEAAIPVADMEGTSSLPESVVKEVQLGFVVEEGNGRTSAEDEEEKDERDYLLPEFLPSKIGGKPSWIGGLMPELDEKTRACAACGDPMPLLVQVYAPLDHVNAMAYHRMILLLACPKSGCHHHEDSVPFRAFRVQLPRENDFIVPELDELSDDEAALEPSADAESEAFAFLTEEACAVCGFYAKKRCSKCKALRYCSRQHQVAHWKGGHSVICTATQEAPSKDAARKPAAPIGRRRWRQRSTATHPGIFKELEICTEAEDKVTSRLVERFAEIEGCGAGEVPEDDLLEDLDEVAGQEELNAELLKKHEENMKQYQGEVFDEKEWRVKAGPDAAFALFQKVTERNPDQVLRYCFGGTELWISRKQKITKDATSPPLCTVCNSPRTFELQIQPQLLYYLGMKEQFQKHSETAAEEFVWRQPH